MCDGGPHGAGVGDVERDRERAGIGRNTLKLIGATGRDRDLPSIGRETARNKAAVLYLIERAGCRYDVIGKTRTHCGPLFDDFEVATGWMVNRFGTDTATAGTWQRSDPSSTTKQLGTTTSSRTPGCSPNAGAR